MHKLRSLMWNSPIFGILSWFFVVIFIALIVNGCQAPMTKDAYIVYVDNKTEYIHNVIVIVWDGEEGSQGGVIRCSDRAGRTLALISHKEVKSARIVDCTHNK